MGWSSLELTEGNVDGGEVDVLSAGVNWWPVRAACLSVNHRNIILDRTGVTGRSNGVSGRIMLRLD